MPSSLRSLASLVGLLALAACSSRPAETPQAGGDDAKGLSAQVGVVEATILFSDCGAVSNLNAQLAEGTMRRLVESCDSVPGGHAKFTASLMPNGSIEIATPEGPEGTVPVCVLRHGLKHQVTVRKACKLEVQLEQRKVNGAAGAPSDAK